MLSRLSGGGDLFEDVGEITFTPVFDVLAVLQADDVDDTDFYLFITGRDAEYFTGVCAGDSFSCGYEVAFGDLVEDLDTEVGKAFS